jgi:hypothetical protein
MDDPTNNMRAGISPSDDLPITAAIPQHTAQARPSVYTLLRLNRLVPFDMELTFFGELGGSDDISII